MNPRESKRLCEKGFSLVELMVAMAMSGFIMAAIYTLFISQHKTYVVQERTVAVQQNLRAALFFIEREVRMAGCNPTGIIAAHPDYPGFYTANHDEMRFKEDIDSSGGIASSEDITYNLDGVELDRNDDTVAENIEVLNFIYLDKNGQPLNDMDGTAGLPEDLPAADLAKIRAVEIAIIARAEKGEEGYTNTTEYKNLRGDVILSVNDNIRRKMVRSRARCWNFGL